MMAVVRRDWWALINRARPRAIHFDGDGALEHCYRDYNAPFALVLEQNSFEAFHCAAINPNAFAFTNKLTCLSGSTGSKQDLNAFNFAVWDGRGPVSKTYHRDNAQCSDDR